MSTLQEREKLKGILTILSVENTGPEAAQLRASAAEVLRTAKPDHKLGRIITDNPDIDILEYAAELHRGALFRGGRGGSIAALPLDKMSDIQRKNAVRILLKTFPRTAVKAFPDLLPRIFAKQDTALLELIHEVEPVVTRRLLLEDPQISKLQQKHRLRRMIVDILDKSQPSDFSAQERKKVFIEYLSTLNAIGAMAIMANGPVDRIDEDDLPYWGSWMKSSEANEHIKRHLGSAHGQMELASKRIPYSVLLGPKGEAAILK